MRIIGGRFKGTRLAAPGAQGGGKAHLRPTSDRVRESLFNVLGGGRFGDPLNGVRVLDLFAGSGALGLEALSRGAAFVTFVENGRAGGKLLSANIAKARAEAETEILKLDATRMPACKDDPASLVFLDPPYGKGMGEKALLSAQKAGWLGAEALIVWEEERAQEAPVGFTLHEARRYGQTWLTVLQVKPN